MALIVLFIFFVYLFLKSYSYGISSSSILYLSNTCNYIDLINYFQIIIVICLHTVIWFQNNNNYP